ncbi:hypothetical protein C4588_01595 [Candidatus Parcubacteria bacterium]|nr:MAG: hypothetical protein C4588_01595 [Candidatus Parcubacteria bacterium]
MDEEVRKALRTLERAGLTVLTTEHDSIIKAAFELAKQDSKFSEAIELGSSGSIRRGCMLRILREEQLQPSADHTLKNELDNCIEYHLLAAKYFWKQAKTHLL